MVGAGTNAPSCGENTKAGRSAPWRAPADGRAGAKALHAVRTGRQKAEKPH